MRPPVVEMINCLSACFSYGTIAGPVEQRYALSCSSCNGHPGRSPGTMFIGTLFYSRLTLSPRPIFPHTTQLVRVFFSNRSCCSKSSVRDFFGDNLCFPGLQSSIKRFFILVQIKQICYACRVRSDDPATLLRAMRRYSQPSSDRSGPPCALLPDRNRLAAPSRTVRMCPVLGRDEWRYPR